ncbi:type II toxin-antitoxin system VapC family toxin [Dyadobacter psychrotolerans]|uniref:PIN domain-containing protein n=1 Tax=Dyadobacter psychrotolerans TaxID=2541721 RepID=A0A4R5DDN8_9BACT|nr:PIN domain-containing protein [Dyadobacter psychrotolerans]TDE11936.1 PIN domain-containing protein [Dyadobacter psychrotolerans]
MTDIPREYVADTMAVVIWLEQRKLPLTVTEIFEMSNHIDSKISIWIPAIVLAEIGYLFEKGRIETSLTDVQALIAFNKRFKIADLTNDIILKSLEIKDIPELHDRLIAGTAYTFNCLVLTNDPKIEKSSFVKTILK